MMDLLGTKQYSKNWGCPVVYPSKLTQQNFKGPISRRVPRSTSPQSCSRPGRAFHFFADFLERRSPFYICDTSGVATDQISTGPRLRFTVLIMYTPRCVIGASRIATPDELLTVCTTAPDGSISTN